MQAKDIPDETFLAAVDATHPMGLSIRWRSRWAVRETLEALLGTEIPENLFMAKARKLILRKKLHGCACGCRGNFHLPEGHAPSPGCC